MNANGRHAWEMAGNRSRSLAFTLVELMVTIAILAILLMIAVPSYNDAVLSSKLGTYANDLVAHARLARSEALKRNAQVQMCASVGGTNCESVSWENGWILRFTDKDSNNVVLQRREATATGFKVSEQSATSTITFEPTGLGATLTTFIVCRATPSAGKQERKVTISATGRTSIETTHNGTCP